MGVRLEYYKDIDWLSSWNGYEVGYDDVETVHLFTLKGTNVQMYVNMETDSILEYWDGEQND